MARSVCYLPSPLHVCALALHQPGEGWGSVSRQTALELSPLSLSPRKALPVTSGRRQYPPLKLPGHPDHLYPSLDCTTQKLTVSASPEYMVDTKHTANEWRSQSKIKASLFSPVPCGISTKAGYLGWTLCWEWAGEVIGTEAKPIP